MSLSSVGSSFGDWLNLVEESLAADQASLVAALAFQTDDSERRILSALMLSAESGAVAQPEVRYYANAILVTAEYSRDWRAEIEDLIEFWVVQGRRNTATNQKSALQVQSVTVPSILAVCADDSRRGTAKAAQVLLAAALPAVALDVGDAVVEQLRDLAKK